MGTGSAVVLVTLAAYFFARRNGKDSAVVDLARPLHDQIIKASQEENQAQEQAIEARQQHERRKAHLHNAEEELDGLLELGGAQDSEQLRRKAAQHRARLELEEKTHTRLLRLQRLSAPGEQLEEFRKELSQTNQALVFTCHPAMVQIFVSTCSEAHVIEINSS